MCGIVGVYSRRGVPIHPRHVLPMVGAIAHRGPDGEGTWVRGSTGLGHRRLAIRDLTQAAAQPIGDTADRVVAVFNGEVYNDAEIRRELETRHGMTFRSRCDAEVIPLGYLAWGDRIFDRLEGMFAVGLWDVGRERLVLARDAAGIKPLYVADDGDTVRFASEVKALIASDDGARRVDPDALHRFMAQGYVSPSRTLLHGITQVPPGTVRVIDREGSRDRRFWGPRRVGDIARLDDAVDAFLDVWPRVLTGIVVSDVPVGVLQSGGVDSSLISLQLRASGLGLPLFTASFDDASFDETEHAALIARRTGMPHHVVAIADDPCPEKTFVSMVSHFDGQVADSSAYAMLRLAGHVREHVPVVLSGDGADEFFGGYPTYGASRVSGVVHQWVPRTFAEAVGSAASRLSGADETRLPLAERASRFFRGLAADGECHPEWRRLLSRGMIEPLYGPALRDVAAVDPLSGYADAMGPCDRALIDRCLLGDQTYYLPADMLMKVDAMSMAHGLEVRVPFLDRRMMELAGRMRASLLAPAGGPLKRVLRAGASALGAPPEIVRGRKRGFNVPVASLLRGPLAPLAGRHFTAQVDRLGPYFDPGGVRAIWRQHVERRANHGFVLWALLTFAVWQELRGAT